MVLVTFRLAKTWTISIWDKKDYHNDSISARGANFLSIAQGRERPLATAGCLSLWTYVIQRLKKNNRNFSNTGWCSILRHFLLIGLFLCPGYTLQSTTLGGSAPGSCLFPVCIPFLPKKYSFRTEPPHIGHHWEINRSVRGVSYWERRAYYKTPLRGAHIGKRVLIRRRALNQVTNCTCQGVVPSFLSSPLPC